MQKGSLVVVWRDNGEALLTRTRSEVQTEQGRSTVFVEGIAGCYALDAVREVTFYPAADLVKHHAALENWGGRVVEFLDVFEGANDGENQEALEAEALQEEGVDLGLVRLPSTWELQCCRCQYWEPVDGNNDDSVGGCECPESTHYNQERGREDAVCEEWERA